MSDKEHVLLPKYECLQGLTCKVDERSLMFDIKVLLKEYYMATFCADGKTLQIALNNGQKFCITIEEIK